MEIYAVSDGTIRKSLGELEREGLIYGRRPVGMFVRNRRRYRVITGNGLPGFTPAYPSLTDQLLSFLASPDRPLTQTIDVQAVPPPAEVAERLAIKDELTVLRHRVMSAGRDPICIADAYYPERLVAGSDLVAPVIIDRGVLAVLDELGLRAERLVDEVYVRMPSPDESEAIGLQVGTPVMVQICTAYTAAAAPVSCWVSILPGDQHILVSERRREANEVAMLPA